MIRLVLQVMMLVLLVAWIGSQVLQLGANVDAVTQGPSPALATTHDLVHPRDHGADIPVLDAVAFPQTLSRPIFFPERRFPIAQPKGSTAFKTDAPAQTPATPVPGADKIKFHGVMIADGNKRVLLEGPSNGIVWVGIHDVFEGWTVSAIEANAVTLNAGPATASIALYPKLP